MKISIGYDHYAGEYTLAVYLGEWLGTTAFRLGSNGGALARPLAGGWMGPNAVRTLLLADWVQENAAELAAQHPRDWNTEKIEQIASRIRELATEKPTPLPRWA